MVEKFKNKNFIYNTIKNYKIFKKEKLIEIFQEKKIDKNYFFNKIENFKKITKKKNFEIKNFFFKYYKNFEFSNFFI